MAMVILGEIIGEMDEHDDSGFYFWSTLFSDKSGYENMINNGC
jgi:hypothetical protein